MRTNKEVMMKGVKYMAYTVLLMFTAPVTLYQAFKNEGHPFFWPVLIIGAILALGAIVMGFYSIKVIMDGIFNKKPKR
ncbi:DUF6095 family protein [uncultured Maribacter sp.]|uniref:DUF6095 family protein n=1 Tax=uncultured Maribacter sp. TaxID=431308 RepID=UPI002624F7B4|nr:DUF6095 family protein [uncultured Maribacter sp.]